MRALRTQPGLLDVKLARHLGPNHEGIILDEDLRVSRYEALDVDPDAGPGAGMESP